MNVVKKLVGIAVLLWSMTGCTTVNDDRIPVFNVNLQIDNEALWVTYGVHSFGESRRFIRTEQLREPANFPFKATTYTGFGGILLISGYNYGDYNMPLAYDLACPVELNRNVRVAVDAATFEAVCPQCKSHFNVTEGQGRPVSGPALEQNYALRTYRVVRGSMGGYTVLN